MEIETEGKTKRVRIHEIHMEEDAGKLIHDEWSGNSLVDYNRSGVPLIEIVSEPDMRSAGEVVAYLEKLQSVMRYLGVSDCRLQEGSMRADVNLSVRESGSERMGVRTEMKNLNSFKAIAHAIEGERERQIDLLSQGRPVIQETRRWDDNKESSYAMRSKEDARDYRYFPDPDLPPIEVSPDLLRELQAQIPVLPDQRKKEYVKRFGLTDYAAEQITLSREAADYFEQAARRTRYPKLAANLVLSEVMRLMPADGGEIPVAPEHLGMLADLFGDGRINSGTCRQAVALLWEQDQDPEALVMEKGLEQISDPEVLSKLADEVLSQQEKMVMDYRKGKTAAFQGLMGQMMKKTKGKGNPAKIQEILAQKLK